MSYQWRLYTAAIRAGRKVVDQLAAGPAADPVRRDRTFDRFKALVQRLCDGDSPGVLSEKLPESMRDWPKMWRTGEHNAARYQVALLVRKLETHRARLAG